MKLRIKALDTDEFSSAQSNGYVYGTYSRYVDQRLEIIYVYIDLGKEIPYRDRPGDDPKTKYREFTNCTVRAARVSEQLDAGKYLFVQPEITVVVYY